MPRIPIEDRRRHTASQIAALTVANAFIFQELLAQENSRVHPLNRLLDGSNVISATAAHWKYICDEINYVPIFHLAREVLLSVPVSRDADAALRILAGQALEIVAERAALRHDLMGRIYHKLLLEAKYLGTFYTSVPAATILMKLALTPDRWSINWANAESLREFRIADLACGTGTLLMAADQAVSDNHIRAVVANGETVDETDLRHLHKVLIEDVLHGYDVLASAVHLTASTLALLAPGTAFENMRLFVLPLGRVPGGNLHLGSIDYLGSDVIETQLDLAGEAPLDGAAGQITGAGSQATLAPLPQLDLAVMNPPFVRSVGGNLLFGSMPHQRADMQRRLSQILRSGRVHASATAGLGAVFTAVADRHLKSGGRLALVLPAALTTGVAWERTRNLIGSKYVLEYVVSSHDPSKWAFSENTDLSEVLVVARKRQAVEDIQTVRTVFLNLWRNPRTAADALAVGEVFLNTTPALLGSGPIEEDQGVASIRVGNLKYGEAISLPWIEIRNKPWIGGAFAHTELVRAAWYLRNGQLIVPGISSPAPVPVTTLSTLGTLGPDRRDVYDGFAQSDTATSFPAFWSHRANAVITIANEPNRFLEPRAHHAPGRPLRRATDLWPRAGRLMIAERIWLVTQRLMCVRLPATALSNVWWPFRLHQDDEAAEKALALWLNSTLGLLVAIGHRVPTRGPWIQFKKPTLNDMPVLDVTALPHKRLALLTKAYDRAANSEVAPFYCLPDDPVRLHIDAAIEAALDVPPLAALRHSLVAEPIVSNQPLVPPSSTVPTIEEDEAQLHLL